MRSLLIDDEYISRRVLQEMVRPYGDVESVGTGEEGLQAFTLAHDESRPFDLILLDIEMPGMDGHETLRRIRQAEVGRGIVGRKGVKVIMTTVRDDPASVLTAFREQAEVYLVKPVLVAKLTKELMRLRLIE